MLYKGMKVPIGRAVYDQYNYVVQEQWYPLTHFKVYKSLQHLCGSLYSEIHSSQGLRRCLWRTRSDATEAKTRDLGGYKIK